MPDDLFTNLGEERRKQSAPLADRVRPRRFEEFVGQEQIVGPDSLLRRAIEADELFSMLFWGPPGSGKTTLARIVANVTELHFVQFSAVTSGVGELRKIIDDANERLKLRGQRSILFIDEIHRWNKAQQDALLPHVEDGTVTLIGATTENPSFEVIGPLLSRLRVFTLERLKREQLAAIVERGLKDVERGLGDLGVTIDPAAVEVLLDGSNGDGRTALNGLELAAKAAARTPKKRLTKTLVEEALQHRSLLYDKAGEEHYNVISAFIKSLRGSDPDAALYWLARMIEAGEDARFIVRRMVILASEDIGNADPQALVVATAAAHAVEFVGLPEAQLNLAQAATYLARAPKSNASYKGLLAAKEDVKKTLNEPVPLHLRNAVTSLMEDVGYGKGYKYSHDYSPKEGSQEYLPAELKGRKYYREQSNERV